MVGELVSGEPGTDGEGVLVGQGGVEQLGPGAGRVAAYISQRAQHPHAQAGDRAVTSVAGGNLLSILSDRNSVVRANDVVVLSLETG